MKNLKFEYKVVDRFNHELHEINLSTFLNKQGQEGWELVNVEIRYSINEPTIVNRRKFYFKRKQ